MQMNMVQAINLALREEMTRDDRVILLGEDVGKDGGVFRVSEGLQEAFGPDRVIDTPLSESAIVGAAIGMAAYGLLPVAEIQFMGFIYAALDQIFSHAARLRGRSRGRYSCPLVVRTPYGAGIKAPELHEESTEALFCQMPGIKVVVPSGPYNAKGLLLSAIRDPDPVIFLEPTRLYRMIREEVPEGEYTVPLGQAGSPAHLRFGRGTCRHHRPGGDPPPERSGPAGGSPRCDGAAGKTGGPLSAVGGTDQGGAGRDFAVLR